MSQPNSVRREAAILIVDDHAPMREAIRVCIEGSFSGLPIIEAPDGATALRYVEAHCPSLVLMDINLPDANGLDLTQDILKHWPCTFVAAISMDTSADISERARAAGAVEFIGKDNLFKTLLPLVGAAVAMTNWRNDLEFHSATPDESPLDGGHQAEHLSKTGALAFGQD